METLMYSLGLRCSLRQQQRAAAVLRFILLPQAAPTHPIQERQANAWPGQGHGSAW
jgi:hypothetical protein